MSEKCWNCNGERVVSVDERVELSPGIVVTEWHQETCPRCQGTGEEPVSLNLPKKDE